jgi:hypothetical protein
MMAAYTITFTTEDDGWAYGTITPTLSQGLRLGKRSAGHRLDGKEHLAFPNARMFAE